MAQKAGRSELFTPAEVAFLAKETPITIMPKIRLEELNFLNGAVSELRPPNPVEVPLWLALFFKKRDKCRISPPDWLEPDALESVLREEQGNVGAFAEMPFHYVEIAKDLLEFASDDLPNVHRIRGLLMDIEDVRRQKIERGLKNFDHNTTSVKLKNLSAMELNRIRGVATKALDDFRAFDLHLAADAEQDEPTQRDASQSQGGSGNAQLQAALRRREERR